MNRLLLLSLALPAAMPCAVHAAELVTLTESQAAAWVQWLCPLPKEVALTGKVTVPVSALRVVLPAEPAELQAILRDELAAALAAKAGAAVDLAGELAEGGLVLEFRSGVDPGPLGDEVHSDQLYWWEMSGRDWVCHALTDQGCYFGMKTLKQLLLATVRGQGDAATVDLPVGRIVDWPDLDERGQWGGTALQDLGWLTDLKHNLIERHAEVKVDAEGVGHAVMDAEVMAAFRKAGVQVVPIIHHLEQLMDSGLIEAYPMLAGKDADTGNPNQRVICFAQPEVVKPLCDWLTDLGKTPGVRDVMIWLSEEGKGCQCETCKGAARFVQELEACVKALRIAQRTCPALGLRVLLTQGSYDQNDKVLAALPADVKVSYYHGGLTYNTQRKPMIYPVLEEYLKQGRWMGVYPTLSSNWLTVVPFSSPEFTHYRLAEFVDKGLQNICAYIVPTDLYCQVNTEGGLEWAWNAHGRTPREFAVSYAVRHGLRDPEAFAQWTEVLGPVAWDVFDSNFPFYEHWGNPTVGVASGKTKVGLGGAYFVAYKTAAQFEENLSRCADALTLAVAAGDAQFIAETRIISGYTQVLEAVYQLNQILKGEDTLRDEDRAAAAKWFAAAQAGLQALDDNYPLWSRACVAGATPDRPDAYTGTLTMMDQLGGRLGELGEKFGIADAGKAYRLRAVGTWKSEDFATQQSQSRRMDVTGLVDGAGRYVFRPVYKSGGFGLTASEVALVSFPKDAPGDVRQEAVEKHKCHAGAWVEGDVYELVLRDYDPGRGYAVVAQIGGGNSTKGEFMFRKVRE